MAQNSSTVPGGDRESLEFTEQRLAAWAANPAAIGLTAGDVAQLATRTTVARQSLTARTEAVNTAKAATVVWHEAAGSNRGLARELVRKIRFFALESPNPAAVYAAAQIPPPKPPQPLPVPGVPTGLRVGLDTQGRAVVRFKASRFGGTVFKVQRRTTTVQGQTGPWVDVGTVLEREFVDNATPSGMASVGYRVRGERPAGVSAFSLPTTLVIGAGGNQTQAAPARAAEAEPSGSDIAGAIAPPKPSGKQAS
ncbi:MAG: hypothetical protein KIT54_09185 [Phycisphaeraceae bacterium]|nr:hypothetical protein [Phycisphaeraceae bacterium]